MHEAEKKKWTEITKELPPDQLRKLFDAMSEMVKEGIREALPSVPDLVSSVRKDLVQEYGLSNEVIGLLRLLASKSDDSYEDLLRKALTLYNVALDARDNGNRLAILNPDDVIVREIVGFEPSEHPPSPLPIESVL